MPIYTVPGTVTSLVIVIIYNLRPRRSYLPGVCLSFCLFVCLLAMSLQNTTDRSFMIFFTTAVSVDKEKLIKFWKSSATLSGSRKFSRILQHWEEGHFPQFGSYLRKKLIRSSHKKLSDISLDKEVPVKFCKDSGVQIAFTSVEDCFVV